METKVRVKRVIDWTYPLYGNRHCMPYGWLMVTDGVDTKAVKTQGDTWERSKYGCQYITFKRKAYEVCIDAQGKITLEPIKK